MKALKFLFSVFTFTLLASSHAIYLEGEKQSCDSNSFSIITLNACMLKEDLPKRFGGMTPASDRLDRLSDWILREDPDIFLGQEILSPIGLKLYEKLKGNYTYFWIGIGKIPGEEESGLFVASKRALHKEPTFLSFSDPDQLDKKHFPDKTRYLERGFFYLDFEDFYLVTTHLEGGDLSTDIPFHRMRQFQFITQTMDLLDKPYMIAGDLNLNRTHLPHDEYSRAEIAQNYFDFYTLHHPQIDASTYTCTNLFTAQANDFQILQKEDENEIDDYILIRKPFQERFHNLNVLLIDNTYDISQSREWALTDHKAYKATFQFQF